MNETALQQASPGCCQKQDLTDTSVFSTTSPRVSALVVGPSAPPHNGMTLAIELTLAALGDKFFVVHLDTADRRGLANIGRFEPGNLFLAAQHGLTFLWLLLTKWPRIIYVPISQAWLPFIRDCLFLIPARLLRRKVIIHLHGGYFGQFYRETSPIMRSIVRYALSNASCAIVLGRNVADAFEGILPRERIRIVPNGIPDPSAGVAPEMVTGAKTPVLLYLSALMAEKGILDLLRALPKVREQAGNVRVVVAGEWCSEQDQEAAHQLIVGSGLQNVVEFTGPVGPERKRELIASADALVLPTAYRFEGHPYVILEAMAAGLPVVSTRVACIPETVRDGVEGFLVDSGDVDALADRIGRLLNDTPLRGRMGEAGRRRFLEKFTFARFAEEMRGIFSEQVRRGSRHGRS